MIAEDIIEVKVTAGSPFSVSNITYLQLMHSRIRVQAKL